MAGRSEVLGVRVAPGTKVMLGGLAQRDGMTSSTLADRLIERAVAERVRTVTLSPAERAELEQLQARIEEVLARARAGRD